MRCISPYANYSIKVIDGDERIMTDAKTGYATWVVQAKPVVANFEKTGLLDNEIEAALTYFTFAGLPEGVNPLTRISVFDTEAYCQSLPKDRRDEMQIQMDQRLRELAEQHPTDFIVVDPPELPLPWPSYDDCSVEEILALQSATGATPEGVYRYELDHQARAEVLEAMLRQYDPVKATAEYGEEAADEDEPQDEEPILVQA